MPTTIVISVETGPESWENKDKLSTKRREEEREKDKQANRQTGK